MSELFNVVFAGELVGRADPAAVRANVGKLFNASDAVLDRLFSGQPVAIKKGIDRAAAMQLRARMKQAGAEVRLVQVDAQGQPLAAPPRPPAPAPAPAAAAPSGTMAARVATLAVQIEREEALRPRPDAPPPPADTARVETWALFPPGSLLSPPSQRPAPTPPVISGITLRAGGGDLVSAGEIARPAPVRVDVSAISMAPPQSEVMREDERHRVAPVQVDISGMSMAEVGAPLDEIREDKPLVNPDISHIKLAD